MNLPYHGARIPQVTLLQRLRCVRIAVGLLVLATATALAATTEGAATVRGKAISTTGGPVAGVKVTLSSQMPGEPAETWAATTSAEGTFSLNVPAPKSLRLAVEGPPGGKLAPCALTHQGGLMVRPGQIAEFNILLAPATASLKGMVTDPDKRPIAGATVTVGMAMEVWLTRSATTDKTGRYELTGVAPGGYVVRAVEPPERTGYVRLYTWRPHGIRNVSLREGQAATEDFELPRGARLAGRVLDEKGKPLQGAAVSCRLDAATEVGKPSVYQMPGQWYRGEATTAADGTYSLGGLTQETYCVEVQPPDGSDLAPAVLRGVNAPQEGDVTLQDIRLYTGGTLIAQVVGADDKPIEGAEVAFSVGLGRHGTRVTAKTDASGKAEFRGLASGGYSLTIQPPEGCPMVLKQFDGVAVVGGLSLVQTLKLSQGAKVTGVVTSPDGKPVADALVMARYGYHSQARTRSDAQGRYTLVGVAPPLRPGPARRGGPQNEVIASPPDGEPCLASGSAPLPDLAPGGSATVNVALTPGVAVTGRVTGPGGKPVVGCSVGAQQRTRGAILGFGSAFTDADGRYTLGHLSKTRVGLTVHPPDESGLLGTFVPERDFTPGKLTTVDITLGTGATLVGEVVTSKGKPVMGARVHVQAKTGEYPRANKMAVSGMGGAFRAGPLPEGAYDLTCTPADSTLRAKPIEVTIQGKGEQRAKVVLYLTGSLTGTVRDGKGNVLGRGTCWLSLQSKEAGRQAPQAGVGHLDDKGCYTIAGLPPGAYTLRVSLGRAGQEKKLMAPAPVEIVIEEGKETRHDVTVPYGPEGKATKF